MTRHRTDLTKGSPLPSTWINSLMEFMGAMATPNLLVTKASGSPTSVQIVAGTGNDQVAAAINGRWRYITSTLGPVSVPGTGAKATFDVFITASDNDFTQSDPADSTNYAFGLTVLAQGSTPATPLFRRIATVDWDGVQVARVNSLFTVTDGRMIGEVRFMALGSTPPLWLPCTGGAYSRATYAVLHAALKDGPGGANTYPYGAGDGSTTFNVPNLSGRGPVGTGAADGPSRAAGAAFGSTYVTLSMAQIQHGHAVADHLHGVGSLYTGNHSHAAAEGAGGYDAAVQGLAGGVAVSRSNHVHSVWTGEAGNLGIGGSTGASDRTLWSAGVRSDDPGAGNPSAHDNVPPSLAVPAFIYAGA